MPGGRTFVNAGGGLMEKSTSWSGLKDTVQRESQLSENQMLVSLLSTRGVETSRDGYRRKKGTHKES